jgi:hypothetical protein
MTTNTNTDTQMPCALGVSDRRLSDFRSDGLGAKEMERLRTHVTGCPTCQARLANYETLARRLRAQPEPNGHAQLWQNVRASIAASGASPAARRDRHARGAGRSHSTQVWAALGSIAAVLALSVGFVALFVSRGGWPNFGAHSRATATPIVIHSGSLTWRQVIVPKGFPSVDQYGEGQSSTYTSADIVQNDGNTAYACQANRKKVSSPVVWATHDAGASWSVITPPHLPAHSDGCRLTVDANAANTLVISFYHMLSPAHPPLPDQWTTYASFDGGATWAKPAGVNDGSVLYQLASAQGRVYGLRTINMPDGKNQSAFVVSRDQMRSWEPIDANLPETQPNPPDIHDTGKVFQIWANPATGEALEHTYAGSLWSTRDDGAHWTKVAFPTGAYTGDPHAPGLMVVAPTADGSLTICGSFTPVGAYTDQWLECTSDGGVSWIKRPDLTTIGPGMANLSVAGMGSDGSIYATRTGPANTGSGNTLLYRLPPRATSIADWQQLGEFPDSQAGLGYQIAPARGHTVIWLFPTTGSSTDNTTSTPTTTNYTQPYYYVATYP